VAVARRISLEKDGIEFEDKVKEQYQSYMILLHYHSKIEPRVTPAIVRAGLATAEALASRRTDIWTKSLGRRLRRAIPREAEAVTSSAEAQCAEQAAPPAVWESSSSAWRWSWSAR